MPTHARTRAAAAVAAHALSAFVPLVHADPAPYAWADTSVATPYTAYLLSSLCAFDDGSGPAIYAGGEFRDMPYPYSSQFIGVSRWTGSGWQPIGQPHQDTLALAAFNDPVLGPSLYAAGRADVLRWNGAAWEPLPEPLVSPQNPGRIYTLFAHDFGQGPRLLAGGQFRGVTTQATGAAMWDGAHWSPIGPLAGSQPPSAIYAFEVFDEGAGPRLFAGGNITLDPNLPSLDNTASVARLDGAAWTRVLDGFTLTFALKSFDDGSGPALYAGSRQTFTAIPMVRKWDGAHWTDLPPFPNPGLCAPSSNGSAVLAFEVFDEGHGPNLFAAGALIPNCARCDFIPPGGVARFRNAAWEPLGDALTYAPFTIIGGEPNTSYSAPGVATSLASLERDGVRSLFAACGHSPTLAVDSGFSSVAGGRRSFAFGQWAPSTSPPRGPSSPVIFSSPAGFVSAALHVPITGGVLSMHWSRNGVPLIEEFLCGPPTFTAKHVGVRSDTLYIECARPPDAGPYELTVDGPTETITITAILEVTGCPADITFDGRVDMQDLNAVLSNYGHPTQPSGCAIDAVYDGIIDFLDLNAVLSAFGTTCN